MPETTTGKKRGSLPTDHSIQAGFGTAKSVSGLSKCTIRRDQSDRFTNEQTPIKVGRPNTSVFNASFELAVLSWST
jgi:hypothetical protein